MDDIPAAPTPIPHDESEAERQVRLARAADALGPALIEHRRQLTLEALADVDAGQTISDEEMEVWANSLGTDRELPAPHSR